MGIYILILLLTTITAAIAIEFGQTRKIKLNGVEVDRRIASRLGTLLLCGIFIFFFAARWNVGTDYVNYYTRFFKLLGADYWSIFKDYRDFGFYLLSAFIGKSISGNYFIYGLILGCLIYIPVVMVYRKYSSNFILTCALYVMLCLYTWPYNGMRQAIAVSILFAGYPLLYCKKKWWRYILCILLALVFHSSVIIIAPFVIMTRMKPWSKKFMLVCGAILVMIVMLPGIWSTLIDFLENIGQTKMAEDYSDLESLRSGVSVFRILVAGIPVLVAFCYYPKLRRQNTHIDLVVNLCVMNLLFLLCGYRVTLMSRFAIYFNLGLPLLIPEFVNIFTKNSRRLGAILIFLIFFLHMIILLPNDSGLIPYNFIFGNM